MEKKYAQLLKERLLKTDIFKECDPLVADVVCVMEKDGNLAPSYRIWSDKVEFNNDTVDLEKALVILNHLGFSVQIHQNRMVVRLPIDKI